MNILDERACLRTFGSPVSGLAVGSSVCEASALTKLNMIDKM